MFFCQTCADENKWPTSICKSYGQCEMCDKVDACSDVPSKYLPTPKTKIAPEYQGRHRLDSPDNSC
jgi:hypothetical protein